MYIILYFNFMRNKSIICLKKKKKRIQFDISRKGKFNKEEEMKRPSKRIETKSLRAMISC